MSEAVLPVMDTKKPARGERAPDEAPAAATACAQQRSGVAARWGAAAAAPPPPLHAAQFAPSALLALLHPFAPSLRLFSRSQLPLSPLPTHPLHKGMPQRLARREARRRPAAHKLDVARAVVLHLAGGGAMAETLRLPPTKASFHGSGASG